MLNTIINVIGVLSTIIIAYITFNSGKEKSFLYMFLSFSEEEFVAKTSTKGIVFFIIMLSLNVVSSFNGIGRFLHMSDFYFKITQFVNSLIFIFTVIGIIGALFFAYKNNKSLEQKISKSEDFFNNERIGDVFIIITSGLVVIIIAIGVQNWEYRDIVTLLFYGMFLVITGICAIYNLYLTLYIRLRRWHYVDNICIKTKQKGVIYDNIELYKRDSRAYVFFIQTGEQLKRIKVPLHEVESVEYTIDRNRIFLDDYIKKKEKEQHLMKCQKED